MLAAALFVVALVVALLFVVRIAPLQVRFAVLTDGQFRTLKGPGLLLKLPRVGERWVRLAVGDQGQLAANGLADFNGVQVPVEVYSVSQSSRIQVSGFRGSLLVIVTKVDAE